MKYDYNTYLKLPNREFKINDKIQYHNRLKTKLKLHENDHIAGINHLKPGETAEFTKTSKGWEGTII